MVNRARKPKKPMKVGGTVAKLAQSKAMGDEPVFSGAVSNVDLIKAYTWYGSECSVADARKYVETYFKSKGSKKVGWIRDIPDSKFPLTAGWMARIIQLGGILPDYLNGRIEKRLEEAKTLKYNTLEKPERETPKKVVSVQDKIKSKVDAFLCELEGLIDDDRSADLYDLLTKKQFPVAHISSIVNLIKPRRDELELVIKGKLKEGYSSYTKTDLKTMLSCYDKWISDAQRYANNGKVIRKITRKPKVVSVDKVTKNIKYQAESKDLKVVSVKPAQIMGAAEVWLFNTKYGSLTVLRCADPKGFTFKASKIAGYDPTLSITKKVGRKAEHFVSQVMSRTRAKLKKLMDEATTKGGEPSDRLNENTLILRVFKD